MRRRILALLSVMTWTAIGPKRRKAMSVRMSATGESSGQVMLALSFVDHHPRLTCQERRSTSAVEGGADLDCSMSVSGFAQFRLTTPRVTTVAKCKGEKPSLEHDQLLLSARSRRSDKVVPYRDDVFVV
jgi:hypothetical protein